MGESLVFKLMKKFYKGYELEVTHERSHGGVNLLYYSVFRHVDDLEVVNSFSYTRDTVADQMKNLEQRVDQLIATKGASEYMQDEYDFIGQQEIVNG